MSLRFRSSLQRLLAVIGLGAASLSFGGCGAFFQCEGKSACPSTTGGGGSTSSGDYAYVSNSASGASFVDEYSIGSGALTKISGSPLNLGYTPSAMTVAPGNSYMYVAQFGSGLIYEYTIGSSGALAIANSGQAVGSASTGYSSMDVSLDGNWLFALDNAGLFLYEFPITKSSGVLGSAVTFAISANGTATPQSVKVAPNGNYVACALGTNGTIVFPYTSSGGIGSTNFASLATGSTTVGDFGVTIDTNNYLYVARTTGPAVYLLTTPSANTVTATGVSQASLTNGAGPHSVELSNAAGAAVYLGNLTDGTISGYSQSSGKLTNLTTSAYSGPTAVSAMARDNSSKYLVATGYNSTSGTRLYTIGTGGVLNDPTSTATAIAATGTSTSVPAVLAVTR